MKTAAFIDQSIKMLKNMELWLDKATTHAKARNFDVEILVQARLAPDMYPLVRQVQSACDAAKFAAAQLSSTAPPVNPDTETTFAELHGRIRSTLAFIEAIDTTTYAGAADRRVSTGFMRGKWMRGEEYLAQASLPNLPFRARAQREACPVRCVASWARVE